MTTFISDHVSRTISRPRMWTYRILGGLVAIIAALALALMFARSDGYPHESAVGIAVVLAIAACHGAGIAFTMRSCEGWGWLKSGAVGLGAAGAAIAVCYILFLFLPLLLKALVGLSFGGGGGSDDDDSDSSGGDGGWFHSGGVERSDSGGGNTDTQQQTARTCLGCGRAVTSGTLCWACRPGIR